MENTVIVSDDIQDVVEVVEEQLNENRFSLKTLKGKSLEIVIGLFATVGIVTVASKTVKYFKEHRPVKTLIGKIKSHFKKNKAENENENVIDAEVNEH